MNEGKKQTEKASAPETRTPDYTTERVTACQQRDAARAQAAALAEALQWIKEVVSERKGTANWLQMIEDKSRTALAASGKL